MVEVEKFHAERKPFYVHPESFLIKFPSAKHMNVSHAKWFSEDGIPYIHTIRGYWKDNFVMLYTNDFEMPDISVKFMSYVFEYFPTVDWIGLGCNKGEPGKQWTPKLKVYKDGTVEVKDVSA